MQHVGRVLPDGSEAVYVWFEAMHTRVDMLLRGRAPLTSEGLLAVAAEVQTLLGHLERVGNKFEEGGAVGGSFRDAAALQGVSPEHGRPV